MAGARSGDLSGDSASFESTRSLNRRDRSREVNQGNRGISCSPRRYEMTQDRIEGKGKEFMGGVKEKVGDATDNEELEDEGKADKVEGKAQDTWGKAKETVEEVKRDVERKFD